MDLDHDFVAGLRLVVSLVEFNSHIRQQSLSKQMTGGPVDNDHRWPASCGHDTQPDTNPYRHDQYQHDHHSKRPHRTPLRAISLSALVRDPSIERRSAYRPGLHPGSTADLSALRDTCSRSYRQT